MIISEHGDLLIYSRDCSLYRVNIKNVNCQEYFKKLPKIKDMVIYKLLRDDCKTSKNLYMIALDDGKIESIDSESFVKETLAEESILDVLQM